MRKDFLRYILDSLGGPRDISYEITDNDVNIVSSLLNLEDYDRAYQLIFIRNYLVLIMSKAVEKEELDVREYGFLSGIVTTIIDNKINILNNKKD